jgi:cell division septation protein DedD
VAQASEIRGIPAERKCRTFLAAQATLSLRANDMTQQKQHDRTTGKKAPNRPQSGKEQEMNRRYGVGRRSLQLVGFSVVLAALSGCEAGQAPGFLQPKAAAAESAQNTGTSTRLVERDIEAPEVFQVAEAGLWDGRPSLGGVWVAHPDVTDPQRVIIRNTANNKFVIGALFRREREIPGPRIQASSDAAAALGMLAGAPVQLDVTALIRESVPQEPDISQEPEPSDISEATLDPIAGAAAAIDATDPNPAVVETALGKPAPKPVKPKASALGKPYIQIGIFNVKSNANRTADQMRSAGMVPTVFEQSANGKPFWRVVVGPAQSGSERSALLKSVRSAGFSDAYVVSN